MLRQKHLTYPLVWIIFAFVSACTLPVLSRNAKPAITASPAMETGIILSSEPVNESPTPLFPTATPVKPPEVDGSPRYLLVTELDYPSHMVFVQETITYTNQSEAVFDSLPFIIEPNRYQGTFILKSIKIDGNSVELPPLESNQMQLPLPSSLPPGKRILISLEYQLNLPKPVPNPSIRPVPFGWTERQTNLVDWYPFIPPYIEEKGWLSHPPGYFGEHLAYEASDFEVILTLKGYSSAQTTAQTPAEGETPAGQLTVAASAPAQDLGNGSYRFALHKARSFALSISHAVVVKTRQVGEITIYGYAFPVHATAGDAALDTTAQSLELYQSLFGSYPHRSLSVVEADFLDGMEYDGLYFLSNGFYNLYQGTPAEYLIAIAAHETAHQWWYGIVGNDQAIDPWLDEALCTYSEKLYYENIAPQAQSWWWTYRIDFYQPQGAINGSIYSYTYAPNAYETYRNAVYLNGAKFLEDLRKTMGDDDFFALLKRYVESYRGQIASSADFLALLENSTAVNIQPVLQSYFQLNP